jgi:predicted nucleic acid-binding protein
VERLAGVSQPGLRSHQANEWHRTSIPDLLIAETALHHGLGVVHVDRDFERIAEVRSLRVRRLG